MKVATVFADAIELGPIEDDDARIVRQRLRPIEVGANEVPGYDVLFRAGVVNADSVSKIVSRNDVSFVGVTDSIAIGADAVELRASVEVYARVAIVDRACSGVAKP